MSDFNSSLPIRTQSNGDAAVRVVDGSVTSQALSVDSSGRVTTKLSDGVNAGTIKAASTAAATTDTALVVAISPNNTVAATQSGTWTVQPGNTQNTTAWLVQDLAGGSVAAGTAGTKSLLIGGVFNSALPTLTNGQQAALQANSSGILRVDASSTTVTVSGTTTANQGTANTLSNAWPAKLTDGTTAVAVKAASTAAGATDPALVVAISPNNQVAVKLLDNTGTPYSSGNPLSVSISGATSGTEVTNYSTAAALAAAATSNHDYTITTSKTFTGKKFWASASGKLKIELQTSTDGSTFTTRYVAFSSTSNPNISIDMGSFQLTCSGVGSKIRIIRTNLDNTAMDVYSTIGGTEA
jgi:hypothetical protein